jgi:tRNA(Ile2) C34 agmatinyltransferase TiaS
VTAVATDVRPVAERPPAETPAPRLFEPGGITLEEVVLGVWEDLVAEGRGACPVCGGSLSAAGGCESCGAELS